MKSDYSGRVVGDREAADPAVEGAAAGWGSSLPPDPDHPVRRQPAFPLVHLLHDSQRLRQQLQATLDAVQTERAASREQAVAATSGPGVRPAPAATAAQPPAQPGDVSDTADEPRQDGTQSGNPAAPDSQTPGVPEGSARGGIGQRFRPSCPHRIGAVTTAAGSIEVKAPRVNDKRIDEATGERMRFSSKILAPWCRKSPKVSEVLPLLYLHGLSSGDFVPALEQFLGSSAGLSPATVTRLTKQWQDDHAAFQARDLHESDYLYVWDDGVHPKVRLGHAHSCVLVLMGARPDGTKELIALAEGLRESAEPWADLLRDCRRRGMRDPELVVGDGAMGLWRALAEVFPQARHQRCWVHKTRDVVNALPKSAQPGAKKALQEIYNAEDREHAEKAIKDFERAYGAKWPKEVKKITDDVNELLAFYGFPAEHWIHLRTTNPIESTFSTVRLRTKVTRGTGSPAAALAMVFKLAESAQARWRAITAPCLVALVRTGARFEGGRLVERPARAA